MPTAEYQRAWRKAHLGRQLEYNRRWRAKDPAHTREVEGRGRDKFRGLNPEYQRVYQGEEGYRALQVVQAGGLDKWTGEEVPKCSRCGCDDPRALQVNHKNGHNRRGGEGEHGRALRAAIIAGRRAVDDLEVLCRPCDGAHYLELRYPDLAGAFAVKWEQRGAGA